MIYTVTFNPSLDYIVTVDDFQTGKVNRTREEKVFAGGKGVNVSIVLKNLGYESTALGYTAGFTGDEINRILKEKGINTNFKKVKEGISRINVKLKSSEESEINGQGPAINSDDVEYLYSKLEKELKKDDILVLAGSIPDVMSQESYSDIMKRLMGKNVKIVVDATRDLLVNVLKYHPFLVKPNNHELGEIFGVEIDSRSKAAKYGKKLQEKGAENVLVSMAGKGAVLITRDGQVLESDAPKGKVVNSVGAGDSMVAGFIAGFLNNNDYEEAFKMGLCTGSASAFSEELATREEVERLMSVQK
ncbi:MAG: 1-phosphofructokinase [Lachnospiraceae bacterium]|nr:1-phosphofructokinase [Lachnospiraceae bacterium]